MVFFTVAEWGLIHPLKVKITMDDSPLLADLATDLPQAVRLQRLADHLRTRFHCGAVALLQLEEDHLRPVAVVGLVREALGVGAWIGAATGAFLIVCQSPIKALTFLIFLLILQQVEGNLIYPKVVGKSVGLPGLWVLAAVTIGGGAFGVLGMLLGVPVCSVVYVLVQDYIRSGKPARTDGVPPTQS